ncbi:MAG: FHA domain-containing protein [Myxococcales bacterium]
MVKAYLLSFLARQYLLLQGKFSERYPNSWLAWEPGAWSSVPLHGGDKLETRMPTSAPPGNTPTPSQGDALCFELPPRPLKLGRAAESDIIINDATVSRDHALLEVGATGGWSLTPKSSHETVVDNVSLPAGKSVLLKPGVHIRAGNVVLTLHDRTQFLARVDKVAKDYKG